MLSSNSAFGQTEQSFTERGGNPACHPSSLLLNPSLPEDTPATGQHDQVSAEDSGIALLPPALPSKRSKMEDACSSHYAICFSFAELPNANCNLSASVILG